MRPVRPSGLCDRTGPRPGRSGSTGPWALSVGMRASGSPPRTGGRELNLPAEAGPRAAGRAAQVPSGRSDSRTGQGRGAGTAGLERKRVRAPARGASGEAGRWEGPPDTRTGSSLTAERLLIEPPSCDATTRPPSACPAVGAAALPAGGRREWRPAPQTAGGRGRRPAPRAARSSPFVLLGLRQGWGRRRPQRGRLPSTPRPAGFGPARCLSVPFETSEVNVGAS